MFPFMTAPHCTLKRSRTQAAPLAPLLPGGERSARAARRVRGPGRCVNGRSLPPHPNPLPSGERERAQPLASPVPIPTSSRCVAPRHDAQAAPLAQPLPGGERSARFARRVRGNRPAESHLPPHPNPLPSGERERAQSLASPVQIPTSPRCVAPRHDAQSPPLALPLPGGERSARFARRVRGPGRCVNGRSLPPHPNPLPTQVGPARLAHDKCETRASPVSRERERAQSLASPVPIPTSSRCVAPRHDAQAAPLAPPLPGGERSARAARRVRGNRPAESHLPPHPNPLPSGERERAQSLASPVPIPTSSRCVAPRHDAQSPPLAPPLPGGERSARFARRVRGPGRCVNGRSLPPHPNPLPTQVGPARLAHDKCETRA